MFQPWETPLPRYVLGVTYLLFENIENAQLQDTDTNIPTMIRLFFQGTVVEWMVEPGQGVQPDDIVAMVETDKVTIEIKADISGVVTKHFPAV